MNEEKKIRLNLGSGRNKLEGYINIDKEIYFSPDLQWDLNRLPWPIQRYSVDEIMANHILEHLGEDTQTYLRILQEIYWILKPGGIITIRIPHHRCDNFTGDPTHVRVITAQQMTLLSKKNMQISKDRGWPNTPLADYLGVDFEILSTNYGLLPYWANKWNSGELTREDLDHAVDTYNNVIDEVTIIMKKIPL